MSGCSADKKSETVKSKPVSAFEEEKKEKLGKDTNVTGENAKPQRAKVDWLKRTIEPLLKL